MLSWESFFSAAPIDFRHYFLCTIKNNGGPYVGGKGGYLPNWKMKYKS